MRGAADVLAEYPHAATRRLFEAEHLAQQGGLARAGAADQRHNFALPDFQVQILMHDKLAELRP